MVAVESIKLVTLVAYLPTTSHTWDITTSCRILNRCCRSWLKTSRWTMYVERSWKAITGKMYGIDNKTILRIKIRAMSSHKMFPLLQSLPVSWRNVQRNTFVEVLFVVASLHNTTRTSRHDWLLIYLALMIFWRCRMSLSMVCQTLILKLPRSAVFWLWIWHHIRFDPFISK